MKCFFRFNLIYKEGFGDNMGDGGRREKWLCYFGVY